MVPCKSSSIATLALVFFLISAKQSHSLSSSVCEKVDSCTCRFDDGRLINLHFANYSQDGKPIFFYYQSFRPKAYFKYSPCFGFPCGMVGIDNTSICMDPTFVSPAQALGILPSVRFENSESGDISLMYTAFPEQKPAISSRVRLRCSDVEDFILNSNTSISYDFTLFSRCACPGSCLSPMHHHRGVEMSVGTVLVLIFFSVVIVYFGIGCLYRRALYGARCNEAIPHREFWASIPPLIKDGYMFFISPCLGNRTEYKTYDQL